MMLGAQMGERTSSLFQRAIVVAPAESKIPVDVHSDDAIDAKLLL